MTESTRGPTDIQRQIDEATQEHNGELEAIFFLSHQRNALSPINMLPQEMICRIFRFVTFVDRDEWIPPEHPLPGPPIWIQQVTHVCRHWRSIALNAPELWTELPLRNKRWTEVMVERSKMAKLTISLPCYGRPVRMNDIATTKLAMMYRNRIKQLSLTDICHWDYANFKSDWPTSVPNLQRLSLSIYGINTFKSPPPSSFVDSTQLRSIVLFNIEINWKTSTFVNLTELKVGSRRMSFEHSSSTIGDLHCALLNMPRLAHLDLDGYLPRLENSLNYTTIPLVKLRTLVLQGRGENIAAILQMISFPPLDRLKLWFIGNIDHHLEKMLAHIGPQLSLDPARRPKHITHLRLHTTKSLRKVLAVEGFHSHHEALPPHSVDARSSEPALGLMFEPRTSVDQEAKVEFYRGLKVILPTLPLQEVTALYAYLISIPEDTWIHPIGVLQQIASVTLDWESCCGSFVNALKKHTLADISTGLPNHTPPFSRLRNIHFSCVNLSAELGDMNSLIDALHRRSHIGLPIDKLTITDCVDTFPNDVERLKQIVSEVDWDGKGNSADYSDNEDDAWDSSDCDD